ncbi:hypothetical protein [Priestia filamentosa]|uniref:hypothetical protein n=1 Tax=Priestia filamentosa TaxID=1402861 RepID=UPI000E746C2B|nr:hypothetical protein [Priestia filamentosa]RJS64140.1 hypothetical protein CJ485_05095 [Priestia filamentosa]WCM17667.1 hypothetical protein PGN40_10035 [Priestia filamentosa]
MDKVKELFTKYNYLFPMLLLTISLVVISLVIGRGTAGVISIALSVYFWIGIHNATKDVYSQH